MEYILSPSILSADFNKLGEDVKRVEEAGAQWLHIDVMDGCFVPNISFGFPVIKALRKTTNMFFDVHLMIVNPGNYIDEFVDAGANMITVHAEACTHLDRVIQQIKNRGVKAGVALNPATPLTELEYVLDSVDMVLLMTVNPGYGGQSYIPYCDRKIQELKAMIEAKGLDVDIQVDGGIKEDNIAHVKDCGANVFVAGSAVFNGNIEENTEKLLKNMNA
ncbi:MAG: ribulose-phosphate 3-epimerase [Lachnospiraceae bacterium]|nr:ribulose-phosphate 3-epimerase [Lachnospiraceae bacterium]